MPVEVPMPRLADTLVEGTVAHWLKAPGDTIQKGEPLAEIETDKVTTELTAPTGGILGELLVAEGTTVPIGTPLVRISMLNEPAPIASEDGGHGKPAPTASEDGGHGKPAPTASEDGGHGKPAPTASGDGGRDTSIPMAFSGGDDGHGKPAPTERTAQRASPLAARIAQANGVNLAHVRTSGNRVTRADVERHLNQAAQSSPTNAPVSYVKLEQREMPVTKPVNEKTHALLSDEVIPLTGLRRATAARMSVVRQVPTGSALVEADVTELEQFYQSERAAWLAREGFPLTYTPFFLHALAQSLRAWPGARQTWRGGQREQSEDIHLGVAVALEDGLIVPVIRHADRLDLAALARAQTDLVTRARSRRLKPDEVTGGIATLTNVGSMGGLLAFPMLNEHQASILGVGTLTRRAVGTPVGTPDGIQYRSSVYLSLTFDRRLLNDVQAERFLLDVARRIITP